MKVLVIVDMQNDFVHGTLGSEAAKSAEREILKLLPEYKGESNLIIFTKDTHSADYLNTNEGKHLPVEHCIYDTTGWCITKPLASEVMAPGYCLCDMPYYEIHNGRLEKDTFGSFDLGAALNAICLNNKVEDITFVGVCTDICVVSNVLIAKAIVPETEIKVIAKCCAGTSEEAHKAALTTMKSCHITIVED
jgi:nicotinamidase-related amidase